MAGSSSSKAPRWPVSSALPWTWPRVLRSGPPFPSSFRCSASSGRWEAVVSSDRVKGALKYFLAHGVPRRRRLANTLVACLPLVTLVLGIAGTVGVGLYLALGYPLIAR